jgi:hypothetical protein
MTDFKLNFIHLCDEALFSQDGKLSLIGIFEIINITALPGSLLKAYLVLNVGILNRDLKKVDLHITIKKVGTKEEIFRLPPITPTFKLKPRSKEEVKVGITLQLANIIFKETGNYIIELQANEQVVGNLPFQVKLLEQKG